MLTANTVFFVLILWEKRLTKRGKLQLWKFIPKRTPLFLCLINHQFHVIHYPLSIYLLSFFSLVSIKVQAWIPRILNRDRLLPISFHPQLHYAKKAWHLNIGQFFCWNFWALHISHARLIWRIRVYKGEGIF